MFISYWFCNVAQDKDYFKAILTEICCRIVANLNFVLMTDQRSVGVILTKSDRQIHLNAVQ